MRDDLLAYYSGFAEHEWNRLTRPNDGAVEFAITCQALTTYLPLGARVLDIGGGPGRYSLWLSERGHCVTLADISPDLLDIARQQIAARSPRRTPVRLSKTSLSSTRVICAAGLMARLTPSSRWVLSITCSRWTSGNRLLDAYVSRHVDRVFVC